MPTRKWFANVITALAGLATAYFATSGWDTEESIALVGILTGAAVAWLVPNDPANPASGGPMR